MAKSSKTLSKITKTLLTKGESEHADFKRSADGVAVDDLVAFANMESGGNILVGITESSADDGKQLGTVTGCDVSDSSILQILNKAVSCIPPVAVEVHIENAGTKKPILRINVLPSENRPHSTPKGVYCRRDGSRNRPLHPSELLRIFLDNEGSAFAERFEQSASKITDNLADLEASLDRSIKSMADQLGWAEFQLDDTESTVDTILSRVNSLVDQSNDTSARLRTMFRQDKREDPVKAEVRKKLLDSAIEQLKREKDLLKKIESGQSLSMTTSGKAAIELDKNDLEEIMQEAISKVANKNIKIKQPSN